MRTGKLLGRFIKDEGAAITVEFLMWIPAYMAVLTIIVDASLMFTGYAGLWEAAHDTSRHLATGQLSLSDGKLYGESKAWVWAENPKVTAKIVDGNKVQVQIAVTASELAPFGFLGFAQTFDIVATTTHFVETDDYNTLLGTVIVVAGKSPKTKPNPGKKPKPLKPPKKKKKKKKKKK